MNKKKDMNAHDAPEGEETYEPSRIDPMHIILLVFLGTMAFIFFQSWRRPTQTPTLSRPSRSAIVNGEKKAKYRPRLTPIAEED